MQAPKSRRVAHKPNPDHKHGNSDTIPWLECEGDNNWYTRDADSALLAEIFNTLQKFHHQGISISPENRGYYVQLAES